MSLSPGRRNQHKSSRAGELFFVSVFFLQAPWYSLTFKISSVSVFTLAFLLCLLKIDFLKKQHNDLIALFLY